MSEIAQFGLTLGGSFIAYWVIGLVVTRLLMIVMPKAVGHEFSGEADEDSTLTFAVMIWPLVIIYVVCVIWNRITRAILGVK